MKHIITKVAAAMAIFILAGAQLAVAQSANHSVTVDVQEIMVMAITGDVTLTINAATAGADPDAVSDNSSATFAFTSNANTARKITASLDSAPPTGVTLTVAAATPAGGTSAGTVTLGTGASDVVTGLVKTKDTGVGLTYGATATTAAGVVNQTFSVTYTLTN